MYHLIYENFSIQIAGVIRIVISFAFTITSVFLFAHVKDTTFTPLVSETMFIALNEIALFTLGILAGFKNNIRLMYTVSAIKKSQACIETICRNPFVIVVRVSHSLTNPRQGIILK